MNEKEDNFDDERERVIRFAKFAGFLLVLVILWYALGIAEGF